MPGRWPAPTVTWAPVARMMRAARASMLADADRLRGLLRRSTEALAPLADPLLIDFGAQRWLQARREEAYSDWLTWVLEQLGSPRRLAAVFGCPLPLLPDDHGPLRVAREVRVSEGHNGWGGRLDLAVHWGEALIPVVEVKTTAAEEADTLKGAGYRRSLTPQIPAGLLALSGTQDAYAGDFRLVTWERICVALRRLARTLCAEQAVVPEAMTLAFVGAVEANLLGFPVAPLHALDAGRHVPVSAAVVQHLEAWLAEETADAVAC